MTSFTIGQLASAGGVGVETVRYYQRRGLLDVPPTQQGAGLGHTVRRYGHDALRKLRFIRSAQSAGFTLKQIHELIGLDASEDRERVLQLAQARVAALDDMIVQLTVSRNALQALAAECEEGGTGPCPILTTFEG